MGEKFKCFFFGFSQFINKIPSSMLMNKVMTFKTKRNPIGHIQGVAPHRFGPDVVDMYCFMHITPSALASEPRKELVYDCHGNPIINSKENTIGVMTI